MIEITLTNTNYIVSATNIENDITVSSDNILFTVTDVSSTFEITTEQNNIVFYTDGVGGFDFAGKFLGPWVSGTEYQRNDVVSHNYSIYISQIPFLNVYTSTIAPPQDPTNWELFYFHESTMSYAVITNTATIGGQLNVGGSADIANDLTVGSNDWFSVRRLLTPGEAITANVVEIKGSGGFDEGVPVLNVEGIIRSSTAVISGILDVGDIVATGTIYAVSGPVISSTGTSSFYDATVQNQFKIGNLRFPLNAGVDGQVLKTNGSNQASWVNLGDLVFWNLSDDLQTNAFNIHTGYDAGVPNPQLTIGSGNRSAGYKSRITLEETPQAQLGGDITIAARKTYFRQPDSDVEFLNADVEVVGDLTVDNFLYTNHLQTLNGASLSGTNININGKVRINSAVDYFPTLALTGYALSVGNASEGTRPISVNPGFVFPDGSLLTSTNFTSTGTGTLVLPKATTSTLGGVIVGEYLLVDIDGRISVDTSTFTTALTTATTSSLGVIKIGQYLEAAVDGTVSVNTASLTGLVYTLPIATADTLGGIRVGSGLTIDTSTGVLSATASSGIVSLTEDMTTNGFSIRVNNFNPGIRFRLTGTSAHMERDNTTFNAYATTASIVAANQLDLKAPIVEIGPDPTQSRLHVSRIYNWAGVGPPFFPAGIQFGDQSVQLTSYYPNDFGPIIATSSSGLEQQARTVDFNNLSLAVDYNLV